MNFCFMCILQPCDSLQPVQDACGAHAERHTVSLPHTETFQGFIIFSLVQTSVNMIHFLDFLKCSFAH